MGGICWWGDALLLGNIRETREIPGGGHSGHRWGIGLVSSDISHPPLLSLALSLYICVYIYIYIFFAWPLFMLVSLRSLFSLSALQLSTASLLLLALLAASSVASITVYLLIEWRVRVKRSTSSVCV